MKHKALFLDRDGVINHDPGDYTYSLETFALLPDVLLALKLAADKGYLLVVITNQGGIARGLYTEAEVRRMHDYLRDRCRTLGAEITAIYFSPHHPDHGNSLSRKPERLMIERALARYRIDPARSLMVGDRQRDLDAAAAAGVPGVLMATNGSLLEVVNRLD
jgi:D-glycero-D-manno-heptose 1,7-bisphosphate phosphatase